jgi:hypothetical protein
MRPQDLPPSPFPLAERRTGHHPNTRGIPRSTGQVVPHYPRQSQKPLPLRHHSHLSPVQKLVGGPQDQGRWGVSPNLREEQSTTRWSQMSKRPSRPLSFNGSIWLKNPDDIVLQFEFAEYGNRFEYFDPPHHVFDKKATKRLA